MFIIVPKRDKRTSIDVGNEQIREAVERENKGPVRTTTACDSCRLKKTKCNGKQPCRPCQQKRIICVYSKPTQRDLPASAGRITLLQHQQHRLCAAVQQMASIIAKYEDGVPRSPSSFDVLDLLDQYAPEHVVDEQDPYPSLQEDEVRHSKRQRNELPAFYTPSKQGVNEKRSENESGRLESSFELQPSEHFFASSEASTAAYEAMMQFLKSMSEGGLNSNGTVASSAGSFPPTAKHLLEPPRDDTSTFKESAGNGIDPGDINHNPPAPVPFTGSTQHWMNLVDWESSLQNLQDSRDLLFSNPDLNNDEQLNDFFETRMGHENSLDRLE